MLEFRYGERLLAGAFSFIAGYIDSVGFIFLGGVFLSFMSGNTTRSATALVDGNWDLARLAGSCIIFFLIGVMNGAITQRLSTRHFGITRARETVLINVSTCFVLASALIDMGHERVGIVVLAIGVGTMNSIFERNGEVAIPLTYMTGTLVKAGQRFVDSFFDGKHVAWMMNFALWVSLSLGAIAGAVTYQVIGITAVELITIVTLGVVGLHQCERSRRRYYGLEL